MRFFIDVGGGLINPMKVTHCKVHCYNESYYETVFYFDSGKRTGFLFTKEQDAYDEKNRFYDHCVDHLDLMGDDYV